MTRDLSISDTGLRLIKAFEGYRPVDRELVTGARVVGYGHRVHDERPRAMTRQEAEDMLKLDIAAYEELINEEVHAPLNQSQFDALCSLAFNIGPKAFRGSDTLRALNNGRVLDAANGFDIWRKATINGQTYVVDALMRRRTAEKSLFLRTEKSVPATTALLEPVADAGVAALETDDGLPVFTEDMRAGVIAKAPYEAVPNPMRRREDQPAGILTLSEVIEADPAPETAAGAPTLDDSPEEIIAEGPVTDAAQSDPASPVREAADAIAERLDALIDGDTEAPDLGDWPQSLIRPAGPDDADGDGDDDGLPEADATGADAAPSNLVAFPGALSAPTSGPVTLDASRPARLSASDIAEAALGDDDGSADVPVVIDSLAADDVLRDSRPAEGPVFQPPARAEVERVSGLWIPVILGFALLGASVAALWFGARALLGEWGPVMALAGAISGALMIVFSLYLATAGRLRDD